MTEPTPPGSLFSEFRDVSGSMPPAHDPVRVGEVVEDVLRVIKDAGPRLDQRVEVWIRDVRDLPSREGTVTALDDEGGILQAYVSNIDDFVGERPGDIFGMWVNAGAWDPDADDEVYGVRVVAQPDET